MRELLITYITEKCIDIFVKNLKQNLSQVRRKVSYNENETITITTIVNYLDAGAVIEVNTFEIDTLESMQYDFEVLCYSPESETYDIVAI